MFKARSIRASRITHIISAIISIFCACEMFNLSDKARRVESLVVFCIIMAFAFIMWGAIELGLAIGAWLLNKHGKVCPLCERVYAHSVMKCPKCYSDMTYAKSVNEFLNSTSTTPITQPTRTVEKHFCSTCGTKIDGSMTFCPKCGTKI